MLVQVSHGQENVLVLKNGNTLSGHVSKSGTQFEIRTGSSRIVIEQSQVDFVCKTLADAYELKFADTPHNDIDSQQRLFYWCLKNQLYSQAKIQIEAIRLSDAEQSVLENLDRQLAVKLEQDRRRIARQTRALTPLPASPPQLPSPDVNSGMIAQVGFEQTIETPTQRALPDSGTKVANPSSNPLASGSQPQTELQKRMILQREMETLADGLPDGVISKYKRQIEPNLIAGCYTAGCHNAEQSQMPLMVIGRYESVPKKLSQRNLHAVLQHVDFENPLESQLFISATQPHGGNAEAVFTKDRVEFSNLKRWLLMFATPEAIREYQQRELEEQKQAQAKSQAAFPQTAPAAEGIRQASWNNEPSREDSDMPSIPDINPTSVFVPRDPFDPEIFNRKYRKQN